MKLGLMADIHENVEGLQRSLELLKAEGVAQIVMLGDVVEMGRRIRETCELLAAAKAVGVWGNHDFGLCVDDSAELQQQYGDAVVNYMRSLKAQLVIDDCYFAHVEPWLDPSRLEDLWFFDGVPTTIQRRLQIFSAQPQRILFAGHYHRWLLVTPARTEPWNGLVPVCLEDGTFFVVLDSLINGAFATYDTTTKWLTPFQL